MRAARRAQGVAGAGGGGDCDDVGMFDNLKAFQFAAKNDTETYL